MAPIYGKLIIFDIDYFVDSVSAMCDVYVVFLFFLLCFSDDDDDHMIFIFIIQK